MNRRTFITSALVACMAGLLSSCATIVSGGNPTITINSAADDAPVNITTSYAYYDQVTFPAMVKVKRKHLEGQRIQIESEKYKFSDIVLRRETNPWAWGNILVGGLIGLSVDLLTNNVSQPRQDDFYITPRKP